MSYATTEIMSCELMTIANTKYRDTKFKDFWISLWRDGENVGMGRAVLRPLLGEARQFVPTDLGLRRQEMVLCLAEASLPLEEQPGNWVLQQGERFYGVRNVSAVEAGRERIYWRAVLVRQEGDVT